MSGPVAEVWTESGRLDNVPGQTVGIVGGHVRAKPNGGCLERIADDLIGRHEIRRRLPKADHSGKVAAIAVVNQSEIEYDYIARFDASRRCDPVWKSRTLSGSDDGVEGQSLRA